MKTELNNNALNSTWLVKMYLLRVKKIKDNIIQILMKSQILLGDQRK